MLQHTQITSQTWGLETGATGALLCLQGPWGHRDHPVHLWCHQPSWEHLPLAIHMQGRKREATFRNTQLFHRFVKNIL